MDYFKYILKKRYYVPCYVSTIIDEMIKETSIQLFCSLLIVFNMLFFY